MIWRVQVSPRPGAADAEGENVRRQAAAMGLGDIGEVRCSRLYFMAGELDGDAAAWLADALLCDPVTEESAIDLVDPAPSAGSTVPMGTGHAWIEVTPRPGVTDSEAESLLDAARMILHARDAATPADGLRSPDGRSPGSLQALRAASTGRRYDVAGDIAPADLVRLAEGVLANPVIRTYTINTPARPPLEAGPASAPGRADPAAPGCDWVEAIPLAAADDARLEEISRERRLSLDLAEMSAIRRHYASLGREPNDVELETLAQTWSEHCVHKTFKALIHYREETASPAAVPGGDGADAPAPAGASAAAGEARVHDEVIDSLLDTFIRRATEAAAKPWVRSAFAGNAGSVAFDEHYDLAFKVETHNHPSALEPFGGANTGVGGVIRDVIGSSARPIANTDVLCFGPPDLPFEDLPRGVLHPRRIAGGVVSGIEDYGNKMGIPTVNGAIFYAPGYTANPLVFCGCLGLLPRGSHPEHEQAGDLVVVIGGRTGRDGLRGATFSSMEMDHQTGAVSGSAVQIGHPIHEKQALECILRARDEGLYSGITDCGAGGLSSAIGEMAARLGAEVQLERVPLKYAGLRPWEIWLSEAQERMVLAVPPGSWPRLQQICAAVDAEATALGRLTGDGQITLRYGDEVVGRFDCAFLHGGMPRRRLEAYWAPPRPESVRPEAAFAGQQPPRPDPAAALLALLATPDLRSKEDVIRRYDHEVQGATALRPLVGPAAAGPSDAAVLDLRFATRSWAGGGGEPPAQRGAALAAGINPYYGEIDPWAMAWAAVDEAMRNCVAAGADPDQVALLDNFCWGNPLLPDRLGGLVRCARGCHDAAVAYGAPFISGKDSLNNEYTGIDGHKHAIPGTLLISALGIVPDVALAPGSDFKAPGDPIYLLGVTASELGGSAYHRLLGLSGSGVPQPQPHALQVFRALHRAISLGLVRACHDCSEGGLAAAAAEMAIGGRLGASLDLAAAPGCGGAVAVETLLFSESLSRFLVEARAGSEAAFEACLAGLPCARLGAVAPEPALRITRAGAPLLEAALAALEHAWRGHIR